ncbi:MAG TPA: gamma-glutamyltransferase [Geminicoccus sp.]|uniref:gamma-glutamyltransferase n=1 Tax=Geminicoccus sp. TaxID=2024832 RepID=UPI002E32C397|nr:gamma-glutamyltransferase [Geminicoccus sp.]HEX2529119.1 gamma-glutamyltransferase [Geminicoccus sp.]
MRDFQLPGRSPAIGVDGMAATSHPLATLAAVDTLRAGGNAVDAAIAAVAVQCVVEPQMVGIGGDMWALYAPSSGGVIAVDGSGHAPAGATIERLRGEGLQSIPQDSAHAVTVPGAVAGWSALLQAHGTRSLQELLRPAINYARNGFPVHPRVAFDWAGDVAVIGKTEAGRRFYLPNGRSPMVGEVIRLPALAATLEKIGKHGGRAFYEGELAAAMVRSLRDYGGTHTEDDFAAYRAEFVEPVSASYRGLTVVECPPAGQGIVALMILRALEGFDLASMDPHGSARHHLLAEATKLAYAERDRHLADPRHLDVPVDALLGEAAITTMRSRMVPDRCGSHAPPPLLEAHKDTVYLTVVDRDRNACSLICSVYDGFGSGLVCPSTGVVFQDRGRSFRLEPGHPNALAPRKRPLHTIIPALAFEGDRLFASFGVMGGQYQPVGHAHVLSLVRDHGFDPQAAIDAPRAMAYPGPGFVLERGFSSKVGQELQALGHQVEWAQEPFGGGQMIALDHERGVLFGGSDPRKDGMAIGI